MEAFWKKSFLTLGMPRFSRLLPPWYYRRFGFEPVASPAAACRFDPGNAHFLALRWAEEEAGEPPFEVGYHPAFDDEE